MSIYSSKARTRALAMMGMVLLAAALMFTVVSPAHAASSWGVELSGGRVDDDAAFGSVQIDRSFSLGSLTLTPGVRGVIIDSSGIALEGNVNLRGEYPLTDWLAFEFLVERGLGLMVDIYCHQRWQVGLGADFGAIHVSLARGASERTVWACGNPVEMTSLAVNYMLSAQHYVGVRFDTLGDVGVSFGWRF